MEFWIHFHGGQRIIALVAWGTALEGYWFKKTTLLERGCLFLGAIGLLFESVVTDLVGIGLVILVLVLQKVSLARAKKVNVGIDLANPH